MTDEMREINLFDLDLPIGEFKWSEYLKGERHILTPALIDHGLIVTGHWYTLEGDSFGPLIRAIAAVDLNGDRVLVWYG